jgi:hypothetical protein
MADSRQNRAVGFAQEREPLNAGVQAVEPSRFWPWNVFAPQSPQQAAQPETLVGPDCEVPATWPRPG